MQPNTTADAYRQRLLEIAYERVKLAKRLEELDRQIALYEAAVEAAERTKRDMEAAKDAAKER